MRERGHGWAILGLAGLLSCVDTGSPRPEATAGPVITTQRWQADAGACADDDGDGYGPYCDLGDDCDDSDPGVHEGCLSCGHGPQQGCPCGDGDEPVECHSARPEPDQHGRLTCSVGQRTCESGAWGECVYEGTFPAEPADDPMRSIDDPARFCGN